MTSTEEQVTSISYIKNGVDYGKYVDEFIVNETGFYSYINSFSQEHTTMLRIIDEDGDRISSALLLQDNDEYTILEVKRVGVDNFERTSHKSILDWCYSVSDKEEIDTTELFDSIVIGTKDESIPLWRILEVAMDEDETDADYDAIVKNRQQAVEDEFHSLMLLVGVASLLLITHGICAYIFLESIL